MNEDIKVTFDSPEELNVELDAGVVQYGKLQIGTTTTGAAGTKAKDENVGSSGNAILNFTIPQGKQGIQGVQGIQGIQGIQGEAGKDGAVQYTAGTGIEITEDNVINNTNKEYTDAVFAGEKSMGNIVVENIECKNLISGFTPGQFYNYTDNVWETGTTFSTSNFVNVEVGETYIFSHAINGVGGYVGCFDENNNFLESINSDTMLSPFTITNSNCKKIICVAWDSNNNPSVNETWMQLEKGTVATPYTPYKELDNQVYDITKYFTLNSDNVELATNYQSKILKMGNVVWLNLYLKLKTGVTGTIENLELGILNHLAPKSSIIDRCLIGTNAYSGWSFDVNGGQISIGYNGKILLKSFETTSSAKLYIGINTMYFIEPLNTSTSSVSTASLEEGEE